MECVLTLVIAMYAGFFIGIFTAGAFRKEFDDN